ncbi:MAG: glycosyltransferase family 39 protein [Lachnospiraceae bacterium]|nr:glycosyltransferase family 39 protein [Lachnospiraceae bacterium]
MVKKTVKLDIPTRAIACIYAIALFAFNFFRIFDNNFWGDEAFSIRLARMSVSDMLAATAQDVHPPLYYLLLIGGYNLLGDHGFTYHIVSIIPYLVFLIFSLTFIWKKFGASVAILMTTFVSLLPMAVKYNVEVRMYSLASLFMLFAFCSFYYMITDKKLINYVLFVLSSLAAAYTHYYAMISVAFFYLAFLVYTVIRKEKLWKVWVVYLATIAGYLPWLLSMLSTFLATSKSFWMTSAPSFAAGLLYFFKCSKLWYMALMFMVTMLSLLAVILTDIKALDINKTSGKVKMSLKKPEEKLGDRAFWLLWGAIASIGTLCIGELICILIRPAFNTSYLYPVSSVFWMVCAVSLSQRKSRETLSILVMILTLIACLPQDIETNKVEKAENVEVIKTQDILRDVGDGEKLFTNSKMLGWTLLDYYCPDISYKRVGNIEKNVKEADVFWLAWVDELTSEEVAWISDTGYEEVKHYENAVLGSEYFDLYKFER